MYNEGVSVHIIEPGHFATPFLNAARLRKTMQTKLDSLPLKIQDSLSQDQRDACTYIVHYFHRPTDRLFVHVFTFVPSEPTGRLYIVYSYYFRTVHCANNVSPDHPAFSFSFHESYTVRWYDRSMEPYFPDKRTLYLSDYIAPQLIWSYNVFINLGREHSLTRILFGEIP